MPEVPGSACGGPRMTTWGAFVGVRRWLGLSPNIN
jgi:hypothetical protein